MLKNQKKINDVKIVFKKDLPKENMNFHLRLSLAKQALVEWSLTSTFHCYPKIFQYKNKIAKSIWLIIFIAFSFLTGFLVNKNFEEYFANEVVSKIQVIREEPTQFPTITICDSAPFTTKQAKQLIDTLTDTKNFSNGDYLRYRVDSLFLNDSFRQSLGFSLKSVKDCQFNFLNCTKSNDFSWFYKWDYGNCLQFNSGLNMSNIQVPLKETFFEGQYHGLNLILGPLINKRRGFLQSKTVGLKVFVHNHTFKPSLFAYSLSIEPGKETHIAIKKTITQDYPKPYSPCEDLDNYESDMFNQFKLNNRLYSNKECTDLCFQSMIIQACGCYFTGFPIFLKNNYNKQCVNSSEHDCILKMIIEFHVDMDKYKKKCNLQCPIECNTIKYDYEVSVLDYPSKDHFYNYFLNDLE